MYVEKEKNKLQMNNKFNNICVFLGKKKSGTEWNWIKISVAGCWSGFVREKKSRLYHQL